MCADHPNRRHTMMSIRSINHDRPTLANVRHEEKFRTMHSILEASKDFYPEDLTSERHWKNPILWKAGLIEALGSAFLNYTTGMVVYMVHTWPSAAIPAGVFVSVTLIVIVLVFAMSTSSGSHINTIVTIFELFSGLCHPVRAAVYIFCQVLGGVLGGAFLTAGVGRERALTIHNGGCWLDPSGPTTISQAFSVEFMSSLCVLFLLTGIALDPRQGQLHGHIGALLVSITMGLIIALTATIFPGFSGASTVPSRCFGLAAGMGHFQSTHWMWWIPDILACLVFAIIYRCAPPYAKDLSYHFDVRDIRLADIRDDRAGTKVGVV